MPRLCRLVALSVVSFVALNRPAQGYLYFDPPYEWLTTHSDAIVIATPVLRQELKDRSVLPGAKRFGPNEEERTVPAIAIETTFEALVVFKGEVEVGQRFVLLHHREPTPSPFAGPHLIDFKPADGFQYFMFLSHRRGNQYQAVYESEPDLCIEKLSKERRPARDN